MVDCIPRYLNLLKCTACLFLFLATSVSCEDPNTPKITIAAASNTQFAIKELIADFEKKSGVTCDLVVSSSGKLTAQIVEGAPFDILLAADMKYPEFIYSEGLAVDKPEIYAYGQLVLWAADSSVNSRLDMLTDTSIQKIALPNPEIAPYGQAAMEVLENRQLLDSIEHKLVYGESVSQTNQFITTEAVSLGFTALSVVLSDRLKNKGNWVVLSKQDYSPIAQGAVIIKRKNKNSDHAKKFYTYLFSEDATEILEEFGYSRNE